MRRSIMIFLTASLLAAGCGGSDDQHAGGARTYYESLALGTPAAAVETFTGAFAADDFPTVYMVFDTLAQVRLQQSINLLQYSEVIGPDAVDAFADFMRDEFSFESIETVAELYLFDRLMLTADQTDDFLIDLSGAVEIGTVEQSDREATVSSGIEGIEGAVEFRVTESPTGRWRVNRVTVAGTDGTEIAWPVP